MMIKKTKHIISFILLIGSLSLFVYIFSGPGAPGPNIIFISIDTLRADHLSIHGYERTTCPELMAFAEKSFVFKKAYATRGETVPSLASVLTGLYPSNHSLRGNDFALPDSVKTLPGFLKSVGYKTEAIIANSVIKGSNLTRDFQKSTFTDSTETPQWKWDEKATEKALTFLAGQGGKSGATEAGSATGEPFFLWVHLMDPHSPYQAAPEDKGKFASGGLGLDGSRKQLIEISRSGEKLDTEDRSEIKALYDEEIAGADMQTGRIFKELKKQNLLENTIVVFFADHGEELGDHNNYFFHSISVYRQVLHVPLIWYLPGKYKEKFKHSLTNSPEDAPQEPVSLIDILPTITSLAGVEIPENHKPDGIDLTPFFRGGTIERKRIFSEYKNKLFGVITKQFHYISNPQAFKLFTGREGSFPAHPEEQKKLRRKYGRIQTFTVKKEELYDIKSDPFEQESIAGENKKLCESFQKEIKLFRNRIKAVTSEFISDEARRNLKQKGY